MKAPFQAAILITPSPPLFPRFSVPLPRSVRSSNQGHAAPDVQEETLLVQGCFFQPAEERFRKTVRNPEVCHQTGQEATGSDAGADRCSSKNGFGFVSKLNFQFRWIPEGSKVSKCFLFLYYKWGCLRGCTSSRASLVPRFRGVPRPGAEFSPLFCPPKSRPGGETSGARADHQCVLYWSAICCRRQFRSKEVEVNTVFLMSPFFSFLFLIFFCSKSFLGL